MRTLEVETSIPFNSAEATDPDIDLLRARYWALTRSAPIFLDHHLIAPMITTADRRADSPDRATQFKSTTIACALGAKNRLREKSNFARRIKLIWAV